MQYLTQYITMHPYILVGSRYGSFGSGCLGKKLGFKWPVSVVHSLISFLLPVCLINLFYFQCKHMCLSKTNLVPSTHQVLINVEKIQNKTDKWQHALPKWIPNTVSCPVFCYTVVSVAVDQRLLPYGCILRGHPTHAPLTVTVLQLQWVFWSNVSKA